MKEVNPRQAIYFWLSDVEFGRISPLTFYCDGHTQLWGGLIVLLPTKLSLVRFIGGRKDQIWETEVLLYRVLPSLSSIILHVDRLSKDSTLNWKSDFCSKHFRHCGMPADKIVEERLIYICRILSHIFNRPSLLLCSTFKFFLTLGQLLPSC